MRRDRDGGYHEIRVNLIKGGMKTYGIQIPIFAAHGRGGPRAAPPASYRDEAP